MSNTNQITFEPRSIIDEYRSWLTDEESPKLKFNGLDLLNRSIGEGFAEETLNLVVAESGFGKTNFLIFEMLQFAQFGAKTIFVSSELTRAKLIPRIVACLAKIPVWQIIKWRDERPEQFAGALKAAESLLEKLPLQIIYKQGIEDIYSDVQELRTQGYKYLFIDHFGELTSSSDEFRNDYDKEIYFVKVLERLYKAEGMTIFAACQFKKAGERGVEFGLRGQDDVRGPSELVKKANTLIYLYETKRMKDQRESNFMNKMSDTSSECVLKLLKAREGHEGQRMKLDYFRSAMQFQMSEDQNID